MKSKDSRLREQVLAIGNQFEDLLAEVTVTLDDLHDDELDGGIEATLRELTLFFHADGAFVVSAAGRGPGWSWEALRAADENSLSAVVNRETTELHRMIDERERGIFPTAADVPESFRRAGIRSMAILPLAKGAAVGGCLGIVVRHSERPWSEGLLRKVWFLGDRLAAALERKQAAARREATERFERLLAEFTSKLLDPTDSAADLVAEDALQSIAEMAGGDRVVLFRVTEGGTRFEPEHVWEDDTLDPASLEDYRREASLRWLGRRLADGEDVGVPSVANLPDSAARERRHFRRAGCQSFVRIPLSAGGRVVAVLGVDATEAERDWPRDLCQRMQLAGRLLVWSLEIAQGELRSGAAASGIALHSIADAAEFRPGSASSAAPNAMSNATPSATPGGAPAPFSASGILPSLDRLPAGSSLLVLGDPDRGREIVLRMPLAPEPGGASWEMNQAVEVATAVPVPLPAPAPAPAQPPTARPLHEDPCGIPPVPPFASKPAPAATPTPASTPRPSPSSLHDVERTQVLQVLEQCHWKINGPRNAAEILGLKPSTLRRRMKKLAIKRPA